MSIGRFKSVAVNVTDMQQGLAFWSAVTGWDVLFDGETWHGWLGYLGTEELGHQMIIIETSSAPISTVDPTHHETNRMHVDIWPNEGVDKAVADIVALGGKVKKQPSLYPRPGSRRGRPAIDWAVMQDPFGNEFCIVEMLTREQADAAMASAATDDHGWRVAAGVTPG